MRIPDKETFKRLSGQLRLGNHFRAWDSLADLEASGYRGSVTQQAMRPGLPSTELFIPNISAVEVLERSRGVDGVYWREIAHQPDCPGAGCHGCGRTINLEAMRGDRGMCLRYARHPTLNLRHDLIENGREVQGLEAVILLRRYLQEDFEVLQEIWGFVSGCGDRSESVQCPGGRTGQRTRGVGSEGLLMGYIETPTDEALRAKWERGAERYGADFVGHPLTELDEELLDGLNYVAESERQGWLLPGFRARLRAMREELVDIYRESPTAPRSEGKCPTG